MQQVILIQILQLSAVARAELLPQNHLRCNSQQVNLTQAVKLTALNQETGQQQQQRSSSSSNILCEEVPGGLCCCMGLSSHTGQEGQGVLGAHRGVQHQLQSLLPQLGAGGVCQSRQVALLL